MQSGAGWGLGHALLSILGKVPIHQPLERPEGVLCFNGEIYNFVELAKQDPVLASSLANHSDTEVLAAGLSYYGENLLPRLNGMYAIAWWDLSKGEGFLARDPAGIKPLYYALRDDTLHFASETRALLHLADLPGHPDPAGLYASTRFRYPVGDRSLFKGIRMLRPGHILHWRQGHVELRRFAVPDPVGAPIPFERDAQEEIRKLLNKSVLLQTRSDRNFCTFLSGGVDSSLLSAMARRQVQQLDTFSVGFELPNYDEGGYAQAVADHIGSVHHAYRLSEESYREEHRALVRHLGEPVGVPNQVALFWLCRHLARSHRCVLSGEGADEVFGGYGRIFLLGLDWLRLTGNMALDDPEPLMARWPQVAERFSDFFHDRYAYVSEAEARQLLSPYLDELSFKTAEAELREEIATLMADLGPEPGQLMRLFQRLHLPGLLLRLDSATMAHGVEGRVPFLDSSLVAFLNALPWAWKLNPQPAFEASVRAGIPGDVLSGTCDDPKHLLKQMALDWLPEAIVYRTKLGFPIPRAFYARNPLPPGIESEYGAWVHINLQYWTS